MVAAGLAREAGYRLLALTIDYDQRHRIELEAAARIAAELGVERQIVLPLDLTGFGGSALTADIAVPKTGVEAGAIPVTYVPARNTIFLSLCLGWAEAAGARDLFIGVNALDYSGYPDCRPEFIRAFEATREPRHQGGGRRRRLHRPHAADRDDQGRHRPRGGAARARCRAELVLLRSRARPAAIAGFAIPAGCAPGASPRRACPIRRATPLRHELRGQGDLPDPPGRGDAGGAPRRVPALRRLQSLERAARRIARRRHAPSAIPISSAWMARMAAATRLRRWPSKVGMRSGLSPSPSGEGTGVGDVCQPRPRREQPPPQPLP